MRDSYWEMHQKARFYLLSISRPMQGLRQVFRSCMSSQERAVATLLSPEVVPTISVRSPRDTYPRKMEEVQQRSFGENKPKILRLDWR